MNLQEFINYRELCPICDSPIKFSFHSRKKQRKILEDNRHVIMFELRGLKKNQKNIFFGYSINSETNDFFIDFYSSDKNRLTDQVNMSLIERFKEYYSNAGSFRASLECNSCFRYSLISEPIEIDFESKQILPIEISTEYFGLVTNEKDEHHNYGVYRLTNYFKANESKLVYFKCDNVYGAELYQIPYGESYIELPLIKFVSYKETTNRVSKLLTFS